MVKVGQYVIANDEIWIVESITITKTKREIRTEYLCKNLISVDTHRFYCVKPLCERLSTEEKKVVAKIKQKMIDLREQVIKDKRSKIRTLKFNISDECRDARERCKKITKGMRHLKIEPLAVAFNELSDTINDNVQTPRFN